MKDVRILGVDLGKNSCSIVGLDGAGRVLLRRRTRREGVIALAAKLPGCVVAMEACCGAHHLGRLLVEQGHEVRLMSPEYVRPYVKAQKRNRRPRKPRGTMPGRLAVGDVRGSLPAENRAACARRLADRPRRRPLADGVGHAYDRARHLLRAGG